jgi:hypothetical protein
MMSGIAISLMANFGPLMNTHDIDGEAAVQIVRQFAHTAGFGGNLQVTGLSQIDGERWRIGKGMFENVEITLQDKRVIRSFVSSKGVIHLFQLIQPGHESLQSNDPLPKGKDVVGMARRVLAAAHPTGNYTLRPFGQGLWGPFRSVFFDMTVAGHPFFNLNPTYAYNINLDGRSGQVNWFSRPPEIPRVTATEPKIPSNSALALLEHWARTHYIHGMGVTSMFAPTSPWHPTTTAELGYFKFQKEPKARLVWEAHVWTHIRNSPSTEGGLLRMYVDAVTGELISPDDPGIG